MADYLVSVGVTWTSELIVAVRGGTSLTCGDWLLSHAEKVIPIAAMIASVLPVNMPYRVELFTSQPRLSRYSNAGRSHHSPLLYHNSATWRSGATSFRCVDVEAVAALCTYYASNLSPGGKGSRQNRAATVTGLHERAAITRCCAVNAAD